MKKKKQQIKVTQEAQTELIKRLFKARKIHFRRAKDYAKAGCVELAREESIRAYSIDEAVDIIVKETIAR